MWLARVRGRPGPIFPFQEEPSSLPALDVDLARHQEREAALAGLRIRDVEGGDALPDGPDGKTIAKTIALCSSDALFTAATLTALVRASTRGGVVQAAVAHGTPLHDRVSPLVPGARRDAHLLLPLWAGALSSLRPGDMADPARTIPGAAVVPLCDEDEHESHRTAPFGPAPSVLRIPAGNRLGGRMVHWLHVLELNLALLARARRSLPNGGTGVVRRGRAKVHPTALVEGSILEDGVVVEAHASIIGSYVGAGARIADHSVIYGSVIGPRCQTLVDTHLRRVVAMSGSTLSNVCLEDVVIGRDVFVTTAVTFFGGTPGATVFVDGQDTGRPCLGGAIGHGAILGARALFVAGQAVPPGAVIVMRPDEGAGRLDEPGLLRTAMHHGDPSREA